MLFSSLEFLFLFLPISVAVYFLLPRAFKNFWLLLSGVCFYAFGEPRFLPIMLLTVAIDFLFALLICKRQVSGHSARLILWLAVAYNVGQLVYFKFISDSLPIGISFYTFQALSYVIDVYRKSVEVSRDPIAFGAYVTLYPQLIAGPIVRYSDVDKELRKREHTVDAIASGVRSFCAGLSKKVLLADVAGEAWEIFSGRGGFVDAYVGIFFFAMQIYFDFSGYSDMACGLGRIFGFSFPKNFNYPYISKSITEFWRRWHITLSSFFKEYVYISLGGNRDGKLKTYRNLLITWALTGLWHGATLNFLLWGLYFALVLILEKAFLKRFLEKLPKFLRHTYAIFLIAIGWVIFATDGESLSLYEGGRYMARFFGFGTSGFCSYFTLYELSRYLVVALILIFGATPLPKKLYGIVCERFPKGAAMLNVILPMTAFLLCVAYIVNSGYHPFLYLRF